jgi:hypothetical protein
VAAGDEALSGKKDDRIAQILFIRKKKLKLLATRHRERQRCDPDEAVRIGPIAPWAPAILTATVMATPKSGLLSRRSRWRRKIGGAIGGERVFGCA